MIELCGIIIATEPATRGKPARSDQPILAEGNLVGIQETVSVPRLVILFNCGYIVIILSASPKITIWSNVGYNRNLAKC